MTQSTQGYCENKISDKYKKTLETSKSVNMKGVEAAVAVHSFPLASFHPPLYAHNMKGDHRTAGSYTTEPAVLTISLPMWAPVSGEPRGSTGPWWSKHLRGLWGAVSLLCFTSWGPQLCVNGGRGDRYSQCDSGEGHVVRIEPPLSDNYSPHCL